MGLAGLVLIVISWLALGRAEDVANWHQGRRLGKETVSHLHFYFHEISNGNNPTVVKVGGPQKIDPSTLFGTVWMEDSPLREGPKNTSALVGRAQGLTGADDQAKFGLIMALVFGFTQGKYNGSSLSIFGRKGQSDPVQEVPVVGGTGLFRMARGFAMARTFLLSPDTGLAIIEYNVTVVHYESN
ncbi:Plant disease resistance response protein [Cinnamomum micranthum f. kanehirae]|uniref:Dirigent protein n=1 Tax=Cinnamomum micranthum f. kanehirae TaxID=337451 RepID=A0A3S3NKS3_9MAGN|nr:Plant disease resistance response protein [Cinnamomum micranthum f. kanehirae]